MITGCFLCCNHESFLNTIDKLFIEGEVIREQRKLTQEDKEKTEGTEIGNSREDD